MKVFSLPRAKSGRSTSRTNSLIREPETVRLQKDIERITERLEYEKRESNYLDERISMMNHEISLISQKEHSSTAHSLQNHSLKSSLLMLEKKLEFEMIQLNEAKAENKKIRKTIDEYRLERLSYKRSLNCLQDDLRCFSSQAENKNSEYRRGGELDQVQKKKISMLRCRSVNEQSRYTERLSQLRGILDDEKQLRSKVFQNMEKEAKLNINRPIEGIEVSRILKIILGKWSLKTKDKKKHLDSYTKHIKVVEDAFKQIKQATGIPSIEEIVTAFIKSQEQNYQIYKYMNNLTSEIDTLEDYLERTKQKISLMENFKDKGEKHSTEIYENLQKQSKNLERKIDKKQKEINQLKFLFLTLFKTIGNISNTLESLPIHPQLNKTFKKSWLDDINEENMMNSLGFIEEFINYMIILLAFTGTSNKALLEHIPLSVFDSKKYEPKSLEIKNFLDEKDLLDDRDLEDIKNPLPESDFKSKAFQLLEKKIFSESKSSNK